MSEPKEASKKRKLSTAEKVLSYPARVAMLGGLALGKTAEQAAYNSGMLDKTNPKFSKDIREGRGYENAKKLGRMAVGIDSIDEDDNGTKRGGSGAYAKGGAVKGCGCAKRGVKKCKTY